jgi:hypothetical protein
MTAWTCRATRRSLEAYHDNELPVEQQVAIQSHLRQCPDCASERARLRGVGASLRATASVRAVPDPEALGRRLLAQLPVQRQQSWGLRFRALFDDMHLVWPALGATIATLACVAAALGFMRLALKEQPASMAALIGALADPGSNQNPVSLDGRILLPQADPAEFLGSPVVDREQALFALAAVVTREGRVRNLELLLQDAGRSPIGERAILELLDQASQTRFEPARDRGAPIAVNMVWLLAQTRVRGHLVAPAPIARPRGVTRSVAPATVPPVAGAPTPVVA